MNTASKAILLDKQGPSVQHRELCFQYPMINHKGKEYIRKECIYMYN